jgi:hypothetical protein
MGSGEH